MNLKRKDNHIIKIYESFKTWDISLNIHNLLTRFDMYPDGMSKMNVMRTLRVLGEPMLVMIKKAIAFSDQYHNEIAKPKAQQDERLISYLEPYKECNEDLQPSLKFLTMTTDIINILQDPLHGVSSDPNDQVSVEKIQVLQSVLKRFTEWRDRCLTFDDRKTNMRAKYASFVTKEASDDFIQLVTALINLIKINTSEVTIEVDDGQGNRINKTYFSYIILRGISQDRQENRFAVLKNVIQVRNHRETMQHYITTSQITEHSIFLNNYGKDIGRSKDIHDQRKRNSGRECTFGKADGGRTVQNMKNFASLCANDSIMTETLLQHRIDRNLNTKQAHDEFDRLYYYDDADFLQIRN